MLSELFKKHNSIALVLKITGSIVIVYGFIRGIKININMMNEYGELIFIPLSEFYTPIIIGLLIIGFGEVIDLLQEIANKGKPVPKTKEKPDPLPVPIPKIPLYVEAEINEFYSTKGVKVTAIEPTKKRDIFIVEVDGRTEYIELGGFSPVILSEQEAQEWINKQND